MHVHTKTAIWMLGLTLTLTACTDTTPVVVTPLPEQKVNVTVLGLNDFHGNLLPTGFAGVKLPDPKDATKTVNLSTGGAEIIGGYVDSVRASNPNTIFVGAGDLIGASPVISSLLRDEPAVKALSDIGMKASSLGNHEFDQGLKELLRMQNGGCDSNAPDKACKFDATYAGAKFKWLGANVVEKDSGKNPFAPYYIEEVGGAKIAFVGAVTKTTPGIVSPSGVATLNFLDEAESANKYVPELKKLNVDAIILLIHEGGEVKLADGKTIDLDAYMRAGCMNLSGALVDITKRLDPAFSAVISGHSHQGYNCLVGNVPVIQGDFYGHLLQRLDLTVDKANHKLLSIKAENVLMDTRSLPKSAAMTTLVGKAKGLTDAVGKVVVGKIATPQISKATNPAGESALGDVIADSQLAATSAAAQGGAVIALMNPGGIRVDLIASAPDNAVTFADVFAVQPFGNTLTVMTLTGAQIKTVLEQQWQGQPEDRKPRILQISKGFTYTYDAAQPDGSKIIAESMKLNGAVIDLAAKYRVVANSFLADGGDVFVELKNGTDRLSQPNLVDVDAFVAYLKANNPTVGGAQDRIVKK